MDCSRDLAEGGDVGRRLLAPRIPGAVHLVSEPQEDRDALSVVTRQAPGELGDSRVGDRAEPAVGFEGEHQRRMLPDQSADSGIDETGRASFQRERCERDVERWAPAEPIGESGRAVVFPVEVDPEVDAAVPRFEEGAG